MYQKQFAEMLNQSGSDGHFIRKVAQFRAATGLASDPFGSGTQDHAGMVASEDKELYQSLNEENIVLVADALVDRIVFAAGWLLDGGSPAATQYIITSSRMTADVLGIPLMEAFNEIMASNMSKVFVPVHAGALEDEKQALTHKYNVGIVYEQVPGGNYVFKVDSHFEGSDTSEYPIGKLLKPSTYFKPDLYTVMGVTNPDGQAAE